MRLNQQFLDAVIEELSALLPKDKLLRMYEQATREPYSFLFVYYLKPRNEMFYKRVSRLRKTLMGAALSFLGQKLFANSTLINARCQKTSPSIIRRTGGGWLRKRMTTIYVDSRKRVAGLDSASRSTWESPCTCRATPGSGYSARWTGRCCLGAYTGARLAAWIRR